MKFKIPRIIFNDNEVHQIYLPANNFILIKNK